MSPARAWGHCSASRSRSCGDQTDPPPMIERRLETWYRSRSGHSSSRHACVGTSRQAVTSCSSVIRSCTSGDQRPGGGRYTSFAPVVTAGIAAAVSPETWKSGSAAISQDSVGVVPAAAFRNAIDCAQWMLLRCVSTAAFGLPVVPLVNKNANGSSSSMGVVGSVASPANQEVPASSRSACGRSGTWWSRRARRASSPMSSFGSVSRMPCSSSAPVHQALSSTTAPPSTMTAQIAITCSYGSRRRWRHGRRARCRTRRAAPPRCWRRAE